LAPTGASPGTAAARLLSDEVPFREAPPLAGRCRCRLGPPPPVPRAAGIERRAGAAPPLPFSCGAPVVDWSLAKADRLFRCPAARPPAAATKRPRHTSFVPLPLPLPACAAAVCASRCAGLVCARPHAPVKDRPSALPGRRGRRATGPMRHRRPLRGAPPPLTWSNRGRRVPPSARPPTCSLLPALCCG